MKNVALFTDVSNLFHCIGKRYKRKLNYQKYLAEISKDGELYRAIAYGTYVGDFDIKFIDCLRLLGFDTKYKQPRIINTPVGQKTNRKGVWNVELSMDVVRHINKVDTVIIGSSDVELIPLIEWIKNQGVKVIIFACNVHYDLRMAADQWLEINESLLEEEELEPQLTES